MSYASLLTETEEPRAEGCICTSSVAHPTDICEELQGNVDYECARCGHDLACHWERQRLLTLHYPPSLSVTAQLESMIAKRVADYGD